MYTLKRSPLRRLWGAVVSGLCSFVLLGVPASGECCVCYKNVRDRPPRRVMVGGVAVAGRRDLCCTPREWRSVVLAACVTCAERDVREVCCMSLCCVVLRAVRVV